MRDHGIIAARPGCIFIRVSREMSFGPNTKRRAGFQNRATPRRSARMQHPARGLDHTQTLIECPR